VAFLFVVKEGFCCCCLLLLFESKADFLQHLNQKEVSLISHFILRDNQFNYLDTHTKM
jgi:hypothetical protein